LNYPLISQAGQRPDKKAKNNALFKRHCKKKSSTGAPLLKHPKKTHLISIKSIIDIIPRQTNSLHLNPLITSVL
jgi:hypothetical protein